MRIHNTFAQIHNFIDNHTNSTVVRPNVMFCLIKRPKLAQSHHIFHVFRIIYNRKKCYFVAFFVTFLKILRFGILEYWANHQAKTGKFGIVEHYNDSGIYGKLSFVMIHLGFKKIQNLTTYLCNMTDSVKLNIVHPISHGIPFQI